MNNGYLYSFFSKDKYKGLFFKEFLKSYNSLKKVLPESKVCIHTNIKFENSYGIDHVIHNNNFPHSSICKAYGLLSSPFDNTIYLDTDTFIHKPSIDQIFIALKDFYFCAAHGTQNACGSIYPDFNTGVIGFKKSYDSLEKVKSWINYHDDFASELILKNRIKQKSDLHNDQFSFRKLFLQSKKDFYILPQYFNYRWSHIKSYVNQAILTHDHSFKKDVVTRKIINSYKKTL
jgi:hypothetical protein